MTFYSFITCVTGCQRYSSIHIFALNKNSWILTLIYNCRPLGNFTTLWVTLVFAKTHPTLETLTPGTSDKSPGLDARQEPDPPDRRPAKVHQIVSSGSPRKQDYSGSKTSLRSLELEWRVCSLPQKIFGSCLKHVSGCGWLKDLNILSLAWTCSASTIFGSCLKHWRGWGLTMVFLYCLKHWIECGLDTERSCSCTYIIMQ